MRLVAGFLRGMVTFYAVLAADLWDEAHAVAASRRQHQDHRQ